MTQTPTTDADLQRIAAESAAAAAEAQAELGRREQERVAAEAEATRVLAHRIIDKHQDLDKQLEETGRTYIGDFERAVYDRDLAGAYAAHIGYAATREARRHIRNEAENAEMRVSSGKHILPELRYDPTTFFERLQNATVSAIEEQGEEMARTSLEALR